jgi:hypothetical protein
MRRLFVILAFVVASGAGAGTLHAQVKSDYQVQKDFETEYRSILEAVRVARTMIECVEIDSRLSDLEATYQQYSPMLEKALYPDGFEGSLTKARGQLDATKEKLNIIEDQYNQILQLETRVRNLATEVDSLSLLNSTLLGELQGLRAQRLRDKRAIDSLSALVVKLREGMRQRDRMIFAMVDSLFLQYDKDVSAMTDAERQGIAARIERRNVFTNVRKSIDDNVRFLENTSLTGSDFREISKEQKDFRSKWAGLGPRLAELYVGTKSARALEIGTIDTMLMVWDQKLDSAMWRGLTGAFALRGIDMPHFTSTEEFVTAVNGYLDAEILAASESRDGGKVDRYVIFADSIWAADVVPNWLPVMFERSMITKEQVAQIEAKIESWHSHVSPPSILTYGIIGLFVIIVFLVLFALFRRRKHKLPPPQTPPSTN